MQFGLARILHAATRRVNIIFCGSILTKLGLTPGWERHIMGITHAPKRMTILLFIRMVKLNWKDSYREMAEGLAR